MCLLVGFQAQTGTGDNHAVSAMKFGILKYFVELGWSVMLSDVDIAILQVRAWKEGNAPFGLLDQLQEPIIVEHGFDQMNIASCMLASRGNHPRSFCYPVFGEQKVARSKCITV
eukprot:707958-Pelagomonas_calceolata.AAC.2